MLPGIQGIRETQLTMKNDELIKSEPELFYM
jgi:hypothetical protein